MPFPIQISLLAILGAIVGAFINWAIYQWAICQHRPISPFMKPRPDLLREIADKEKLKQLGPRSGLDFVPILGWFRLRRDASILGKGCWVRPLLIEVTWAIGLPLFFLWQHNGGLTAVDPATGLAAASAAKFASWATTWFWLHAILIALMFIATFIDFDERMIPDQVTVPGTIIGLVAAVIFPWSRLPWLSSSAALLPSLENINFASPPPEVPGPWTTTSIGLVACLAIFIVWVLALLPKIIPLREFKLGIVGNIKIMLASIMRPARKTVCDLRTSKRSMSMMTRIYLGILLIGIILIPVAWTGWMGPEQKISLVSSFIGLGIAGGLIWGIRIVAGLALGQEAMGFGDVTLMCMIGAFLGWQASLAGFVYSIIFAFVLAIILFVITKKSYLAFGPYLCMGSLMALLRWPAVLKEFDHVFFLGPILLLFFGGSLVMMAVLLPLIRWLKESMLGVEEELGP